MSIYWLYGLEAILVTLFIFSRASKQAVGSVFNKALASVAFVMAGIVAINKMGYTDAFGYLLLGAVFGLIGDIFMELNLTDEQNAFGHINAGMASFGMGHLLYLVALVLLYGSFSEYLVQFFISLGVSLAFAGVLVFVLAKPLKLDFGRAKWQSASYAFVLTFATVFSLMLSIKTNSHWIMTAGFGAFLVSDMILSMQLFGGKKDNMVLSVLVHVFYYAAQMAIVSQIAFL